MRTVNERLRILYFPRSVLVPTRSTAVGQKCYVKHLVGILFGALEANSWLYALMRPGWRNIGAHERGCHEKEIARQQCASNHANSPFTTSAQLTTAQTPPRRRR